MPSTWVLMVVTFSVLFTAAEPYMIDAECGVDTQFVRTHVDEAFRLAAQGVIELTRQPISQEIDYLFRDLFGRRVSEMDPNRVVERLNALAAISQYTQTDQTNRETTDVKFYCTTSRVAKRSDGRYYNKERNSVYPSGEVTNRFTPCMDIKSPTLAWTSNTDDGTEDHYNVHSEIQICPWYLRKGRGLRFSDFKSLGQTIFRGVSKIAMTQYAKIKYRPIDAFILMDKVLLHELTHTNQARPKTIDMGEGPYGWKRCRAAITTWQQSGRTTINDPHQNADSNALFCIGVQLIHNQVTIRPDGSLDPPQRSRRRHEVTYPMSWEA